jgi:hypothetical protein
VAIQKDLFKWFPKWFQWKNGFSSGFFQKDDKEVKCKIRGKKKKEKKCGQ